MTKYEGILLVDKHKGPTSHDVVDIVREKLRFKRIGHTGTLDPMASGLLILLIGTYTSKQSYFQKMDKLYSGIIKLGIETDTWDMEGKVIRKVANCKPDIKRLESSIKLLTGNIIQKIPKYSAVKYKGQTLYKLARKNKIIPDLCRKVNVEWKEWNLNDDEVSFTIKCSSGTYIRSIAHQLGVLVGSGATLKSLRRLMIGDYHVKDAVALRELEKMNLDELLKVIKK
jgi:tRNA pseudouridine55 synthase